MNCPICNEPLDNGLCPKCFAHYGTPQELELLRKEIERQNDIFQNTSSVPQHTTGEATAPSEKRVVESCNHKADKSLCETCAAWNSAIYNQKRAEQAESENARLKTALALAREALEEVNAADPFTAFVKVRNALAAFKKLEEK